MHGKWFISSMLSFFTRCFIWYLWWGSIFYIPLLWLCSIFLVTFLRIEWSPWSSLVGVHLFSAFVCAPSGFVGIYDVPHFIKTLKYDVRIVMSIPEITAKGKTKKLKAHQVNKFKSILNSIVLKPFPYLLRVNFLGAYYTHGALFVINRFDLLGMHRYLGMQQLLWRRWRNMGLYI